MPWRLRSSGEEWLVVQEDTGRVMGRHKSRLKARRQQMALYANVHKAEWDESKYRRGKTTEASTSGSFAPKDSGSGDELEKEMMDAHNLVALDVTDGYRETVPGNDEPVPGDRWRWGGFAEAKEFWEVDEDGEILEADEPMVSYSWHTIEAPGQSLVYVNEIAVDPSLQGQGIGRSILSYMYQQAKARNVNGMGMWANMSAGAYAWTRMGFQPETFEELNAELAANLRSRGLSSSAIKALSPYLRAMRSSTSSHERKARALWDMVDNVKESRHLLKGVRFPAFLDLNDPEATARFERYTKKP